MGKVEEFLFRRNRYTNKTFLRGFDNISFSIKTASAKDW